MSRQNSTLEGLPYGGSLIRVHIWHKDAYLVMHDPRATPEVLGATDQLEELTGEPRRTSVWNQIIAGLPIINGE